MKFFYFIQRIDFLNKTINFMFYDQISKYIFSFYMIQIENRIVWVLEEYFENLKKYKLRNYIHE